MAGVNCNTMTGTASVGRTIINFANPCESNGVLTSWCVSMYQGGNVKLKVFRPVTSSSGTALNFVGESPFFNVPTGITSGLSCNIIVNKGDYIGTYCSSGSPGITTTYPTQSGYTYTGGGDVTSNTGIGDWTTDKSVPTVLSTPAYVMLSVELQSSPYYANSQSNIFSLFVSPQGININDVQLNVHYDPNVITVTKDMPGNLFAQNGATVYYSPPVVDGANGIVTLHGSTVNWSCSDNSCKSSFQNPPVVSTKGVFDNIVFDAKSKGTTVISLTDVSIGYCRTEFDNASYVWNYKCYDVPVYIFNNTISLSCQTLYPSMSISS